MDKTKLAKNIYYSVLVLCIVALILSLIFVKTKDSDGNIITFGYVIRYSVVFYMFSVLLPFALITREVLLGVYIKKKIIIKIVFSFSIALLGSILIFALRTIPVCQTVTVISLGSLFFTLTPTVKPEEKKNV